MVIDDHQIRLKACRGDHRLGFRARDRTDLMPHVNQQLGKIHGNQHVVLDDHDAQRFSHRPALNARGHWRIENREGHADRCRRGTGPNLLHSAVPDSSLV